MPAIEDCVPVPPGDDEPNGVVCMEMAYGSKKDAIAEELAGSSTDGVVGMGAIGAGVVFCAM